MKEPDDAMHEEIGRRSRAAMQAESAAYEPPDAWAAIVGRLDREPSVWSWLRQRPLVAGAALAGLALLAVVTVRLLDGEEQAQDLDLIDEPEASDEFTLIGLDISSGEGELVELDSNGELLPTGIGVPGDVSDLSVRKDGSTDEVWYLTPRGDPLCPGSDKRSTDLAVQWVGGAGPDGSLAEWTHGVEAYAWSPDQSRLAIVRPNAEGCVDEGWTLEVRDDSGAIVERIPANIGRAPLLAPSPSWLDDSHLLLSTPAFSNDLLDPIPPQSLHYVEIGVTEQVEPEDRWSIGVPADAVIAPAGGGFAVVATSAAHAGEVPFIPDGGDQQLAGGIGVWRGAPTTKHGELFGIVKPQDLGLDVPTTIPVAVGSAYPLAALSIASAPDGSVYLTVAFNQGEVFDSEGASEGHASAWVDGVDLGDDPNVALFRITPDGDVEKLREGISHVAIRPSEDSTPAPTTTDAPTTTGPTTTGAPTTTQPAPTTTPTTTVPGGETFYTVNVAGQLVRNTLLDEREVVVDLPLLVPASEGVVHPYGYQLAVSLDGSHAYVALRAPAAQGKCGDGQIVSVNLLSGQITVFGPGHSPAVSPDGRSIAFAANDVYGDPSGRCHEGLHVVPLDGRDGSALWKLDESIEPTGTPELPGITRIEWAPDSVNLAFEVTDEDGTRVHTLDTSTFTGLSGPLPDGPLPVDPAPNGTPWELAGYTSEGIVLFEPCSRCPTSTVARWVTPRGELVRDEGVNAEAGDLRLGEFGWIMSWQFCLSGPGCPVSWGSDLWFNSRSRAWDNSVLGWPTPDLVVAAAWIPRPPIPGPFDGDPGGGE